MGEKSGKMARRKAREEAQAEAERSEEAAARANANWEAFRAGWSRGRGASFMGGWRWSAAGSMLWRRAWKAALLPSVLMAALLAVSIGFGFSGDGMLSAGLAGTAWALTVASMDAIRAKKVAGQTLGWGGGLLNLSPQAGATVLAAGILGALAMASTQLLVVLFAPWTRPALDAGDSLPALAVYLGSTAALGLAFGWMGFAAWLAARGRGPLECVAAGLAGAVRAFPALLGMATRFAIRWLLLALLAASLYGMSRMGRRVEMDESSLMTMFAMMVICGLTLLPGSLAGLAVGAREIFCCGEGDLPEGPSSGGEAPKPAEGPAALEKEAQEAPSGVSLEKAEPEAGGEARR